MPVHYRLLGPVEVHAEGRPVHLGGARDAKLLAVLLVENDRIVTFDRVVAVLWDEDPPATVRQQVHNVVARLRRTLEAAGDPDVVRTDGPGYRLAVDGSQVDLAEFDRHLERAADPDQAVDALTEAIGLWRGPALAGLTGTVIEAMAARLNDRRVEAVERWADARLANGDLDGLADELRGWLVEHPLREHLRDQLMRVLYATGSKAAALQVYDDGRRFLAEELGLDPGPALADVHARILRDDPDLAVVGSAQSLRVPAELPPALATFTGRNAELGKLIEVLLTPTQAGPVVAAVNGLGGVGKSALAVQAAHQVKERFPDGQLYVDLHGATPGAVPLGAGDVLARFLRSLGVDDTRIPAEPQEAAARFRTLTAGRRLLVVLDDVADPAPLRVLLPADSGSTVLVTSRVAPAALDGVLQLPLGELPEAEAVALLGELAGPERVAAEPAAATEIARLCGGLPLALRIAGARLAVRPDRTLASYVALLADERRRLDAFTYADLDVRASCAVSHDALGPDGARLWELLGLLDLNDFGVRVAAALTNRPYDETAQDLDDLVDAQLLTGAGDRYRLHDLLRLYAREQAARLPAELRNAALRRVVHHYLATAREVLRQLVRDPSRRLAIGPASAELQAPAAQLPDEAALVDWMRAEAANLPLVARHAARLADDGPGLLAGLAAALGRTFSSQGFWAVLVEVNLIAIEAAGPETPPEWLARAHNDLGSAYSDLERYDRAEPELEAALAIYRQLGDVLGQAVALNNLGICCQQDGRLDQSVVRYQEVLAIYRGLGRTAGEATILNNLGNVHRSAGRLDEAIEDFQRSLAATSPDDDRDRGISLVNIGATHLAAGRAAVALRWLEDGTELLRRSGHSWLEALGRWHLGETHDALAQPAAARTAWRRSLDLLVETDSLTTAEADRVLAAPKPTRPAVLRDM
ncbi:AfsR/SARP family transcriptional regulator [Tenggerimyces flavus]|uniref:BTAD domain-containing putative transcriptional regulator n=1 Tax=Tenggerimyces flavus TaxID=1708749 RepID=A0ABV7YFD9_9ACTN|nr:AfsR/SARP family transcriptional regulator [Tenggerimyces flavus]MBM7784534.1 DNA-binding SARP family transcriptional activator/Tfp pilus assembly protein PilF [Tenggerimyces flavus]